MAWKLIICCPQELKFSVHKIYIQQGLTPTTSILGLEMLQTSVCSYKNTCERETIMCCFNHYGILFNYHLVYNSSITTTITTWLININPIDTVILRYFHQLSFSVQHYFSWKCCKQVSVHTRTPWKWKFKFHAQSIVVVI